MVFKVIILGSNSAIPILKRSTTAQIVNHNERFFLVDCGEGTQLQLRRYRLKMQRINHILISHLHGDHFFGLVGLVSSMHLLGRKKDLHVYGPSQLKEIIDLQLDVSETTLAYKLIFHPINPEVSEQIYEDENLIIRTIPMNHSIPTSGFLFQEKAGKRRLRKRIIKTLDIPVEEFLKIKEGADFTDQNGKVYKNSDITEEPNIPRTYAYCSDTSYHEPIIPFIKGVDLLYHETTFMADRAKAAADKLHSTTIEAGTIAKKAGVKKLIIGHYSTRYEYPEDLLEETKSVFPDSEAGIDGGIFEV